jgi:hypothetical protein
METVLDKFKRLSQRVSQDRTVYVSNDTLLGALVVGEGFIAGNIDLEDEEVDNDEEAREEEFLFVGELPERDSAFTDIRVG